MNWPAAVARVQGELEMFRSEYLPILLREPQLDRFPEDETCHGRVQPQEVASPLSIWQQAVKRLGDFLPLQAGDPSVAPLSEEDYKEFMFQKATPAFSVRRGEISWQIGLFISLNLAHVYCWPAFLQRREHLEDEEAELLERLPEVKRWLMGLSVDDSTLWNALSMILPIVADADPAFAKLALDPETWQAIVRADRHMSEEQREKHSQLIDRGYFCHVLNNALLHVMGALANNHFGEIRGLLEHPNLHGGYTGLIPHYLFAVLFHKVLILQQSHCSPSHVVL